MSYESRKDRDRDRKAKKRALENNDEKQQRLIADSKRHKDARLRETLEEKESRLKADATRHKEARTERRKTKKTISSQKQSRETTMSYRKCKTSQRKSIA